MRTLIDKVVGRIAPYWPLDRFVAVNPFWGWIDQPFSHVALLLKQFAGVNLFMPLSYYREQLEAETITHRHLEKVLAEHPEFSSLPLFLKEVEKWEKEGIAFPKFPLLIEVADQVLGQEWMELMRNETSARYSVYFNRFEDLKPATGFAVYRQWRKDAMTDLMPELYGMKGFRSYCASLPRDMYQTAEGILASMPLKTEQVESYLHALVWTLPGWFSYLAGLDWDNHLEGKTSHYTQALLITLLCWESYLSSRFPELLEKWIQKIEQVQAFYQREEIVRYFQVCHVLQSALDWSVQENLCQQFLKAELPLEKETQADFQLVFCIDVRSEVIRRHIERLHPACETIGMAGFFGVPVKYYPANHRFGKSQCPALFKPNYVVRETLPYTSGLSSYLFHKRIQDGFRHFQLKYKIGVVSGFAYVSPTGVYYLLRLIANVMGITRPLEDPREVDLGDLLNGKTTLDMKSFPLQERVSLAETILQAIGLRDRIGRLVLFVGHGSESVNNPHASALDCGACGGNSGEVNAILASMILNDPEVRRELAKKGIHIPETTLFWAARHHTVTDEIEVVNEKRIPASHQPLLRELKAVLKQAAMNARKERLSRFQFENQRNERMFFQRKKDWSQVRPEWGLAGCHSFVIAPRSYTKSLNLEGKVFLHEYDPMQDPDGSLLEMVLTGPGIVASWICYQYYASVVDPMRLGAGNKTLHNPVSGIGVLEGSVGDLKIGLPLQSLFDGFQLQHIPVRLNIWIAASPDQIQKIVDKHPILQNLLNHLWIHLFALKDLAQIYKYVPERQWKSVFAEA
jgi:uncharacterized protein YbcC (UPF0753/DUF2309 family)